MIRTFLAVEVSPAVRRRAAELIRDCRRLGVDAKWVVPDNMHLTLQFLGNVRENDIPLICRRLAQGVRSVKAFDVVCRGVGAFPRLDRPRVIWMGIDEGRTELVHLQTCVESALRDLGFRGESRQFEPHLTLGRLRRAEHASSDLVEFLQRHADFEGGAFDVSQVLVFSSHLERSGPRYEVLGHADLEG